LAWVQQLAVRDFRNIDGADVELHPGINVFHGCNAQGKTSLLEALGAVARGRSFRSEESRRMIRRGAGALLARATAAGIPGTRQLELELGEAYRVFRLDGRDVPSGEYCGRLEVVVYSTDRLRVVRGSMRERRQFLDRQAAALWPAYRAEARTFERLLAQRNAALERRAGDLDVWTERFIESGARLRRRRAEYAHRLTAALAEGFRPSGEAYEVRPSASPADEQEARRELTDQIGQQARREWQAGRSLAGPHRDSIALLLDGRDAADGASSGQARSLLLALALASLRVYHEQTGRSAVALLDDLDSELDEERAAGICREVVSRGQALVTSAHARWAESLRPLGRVYEVSGGRVRCA
jgi:DNA replication and repair protein RecF